MREEIPSKSPHALLRALVKRDDGIGVFLIGGSGWLPRCDDLPETGRANLCIVCGHVFHLNPLRTIQNLRALARGDPLLNVRMAMQIEDLLLECGGDAVFPAN